jgi:hypothetical protein
MPIPYRYFKGFRPQLIQTLIAITLSLQPYRNLI